MSIDPRLLWIAGGVFVAAVLALVWGYRRLAARAVIDDAEQALDAEFDALERRDRT